MSHCNAPEPEIIYMPYSFYSKDGWREIVDALEVMGYVVVKTYPDEEVMR